MYDIIKLKIKYYKNNLCINYYKSNINNNEIKKLTYFKIQIQIRISRPKN